MIDLILPYIIMGFIAILLIGGGVLAFMMTKAGKEEKAAVVEKRASTTTLSESIREQFREFDTDQEKKEYEESQKRLFQNAPAAPKPKGFFTFEAESTKKKQDDGIALASPTVVNPEGDAGYLDVD